MKLYSIIPYWLNTKTGETRVNKEWFYLKIAQSAAELTEWAQKNKDSFFFRADEVYKPQEFDESNLKFDFSIKELPQCFITDVYGSEYKVHLDIVSKIEIQRVEIPLEHLNE